MEQNLPISSAMDLVGIGCLPMALKTAFELNVLDIIAKDGPESKLSAFQIVTQLPTNNPNAAATLDRILRLLASHSILSSTMGSEGQRLYGLSPMCKYLLPDQNGVSLGPLIVMCHDKVVMESWQYLKDAVMEGCVPFNKAYGMSAFEYYGKDARFSKLFNASMFNHSTFTMRDVIQNYRGFEGLEEIVDVGGGIGASLMMIISEYPHIKGTNFDLPYVIADAPPHPGMKHVSGDMFKSVPSSDAILMKWILHDWDDERCIKVLNNCWKALPKSGKVIIIEFVLPEKATTDPISRRIYSADLLMLAVNEGGKERTFQEFQALAEKSGFPAIKMFPCSHGISSKHEYYRSLERTSLEGRMKQLLSNYNMEWILHDWDDERCIKVLNNCWKALPESGKVIIVEFVLAADAITDPISPRIFSSDILMLAVCEGGKERTLQEFQALAEKSGFPAIKTFPCSRGVSVIEFYKKP